MSNFKKFNKLIHVSCKNYSPCYRTIVAFGFFEYFLRCENEQDTIEQLRKFYEAVVSQQQYKLQYSGVADDINDCFEFYPIEMDKKIGYLYIDHTHNCYPLVFYPITHKSNNAPRTQAFNESVLDLFNHSEKLIILFNQYYIIRYEEFTAEELETLLSNFQKDLHQFVKENK